MTQSPVFAQLYHCFRATRGDAFVHQIVLKTCNHAGPIRLPVAPNAVNHLWALLDVSGKKTRPF